AALHVQVLGAVGGEGRGGDGEDAPHRGSGHGRVLSGRGAGQRRVIQMVLVSVYWAKASRPLSRPPKPDSLYPPKGVVMSPSLDPLTATVPARTERATVRASSMSRDHTVAARP